MNSEGRGIWRFNFPSNVTLLYRWLREGKIRSISLREPGRKFGPRIFWMPEIRAILLKKLAQQNPEAEQ